MMIVPGNKTKDREDSRQKGIAMKNDNDKRYRNGRTNKKLNKTAGYENVDTKTDMDGYGR